MICAGLTSLAVSFPGVIRTNRYWRERYPEAVASAEARSLSRLFSAKGSEAPSDPFDIAMAPYLQDPFRGAVERRVLAPGETSLMIEKRAASAALKAAGLEAS